MKSKNEAKQNESEGNFGRRFPKFRLQINRVGLVLGFLICAVQSQTHAYEVNCAAMNKVVPVGITTVCRYSSSVAPPWNVPIYLGSWGVQVTTIAPNSTPLDPLLANLATDLENRYEGGVVQSSSPETYDAFSDFVKGANDAGMPIQLENIPDLDAPYGYEDVSVSKVAVIDSAGNANQQIITVGQKNSKDTNDVSLRLTMLFAENLFPPAPKVIGDVSSYLSAVQNSSLNAFRLSKSNFESNLAKLSKLIIQAETTRGTVERALLKQQIAQLRNQAGDDYYIGTLNYTALMNSLVGSIYQRTVQNSLNAEYQYFSITLFDKYSNLFHEADKMIKNLSYLDPQGNIVSISKDEANSILVSAGKSAIFTNDDSIALTAAQENQALVTIQSALSVILKPIKKGCSFNGANVADGDPVTAYTSSSMPRMLGCTPARQTRTCNDGTLSGWATYSYCSVSPY